MTIDLSPRSAAARTGSRRRKRRWAPLVVLALVLVAGGVIVTQFLRSAVDYYCNVDEIGSASGCEPGRRLRVQGTVDRGQVVTDDGITTFTISFDGATLPVRYEGQPGGHLRGVPAGRRPRRAGRTARSRVTASRSSTPTSTRRRTPTASTRPPAESDDVLAASLNGALGRAGLMLAPRRGVVRGAGDDLRRAPRRPPDPAHGAASTPGCASAAPCSPSLMMQRALITRDFSLAYVQQVGSATTPALYNVAAMWSALEGSILLWVVILAGFTAAVGWRFRRRTEDPLVGWALVVMFVVMAFFALLSFGPADPFADGAAVPAGFDGPGPNPLLQNHVLVLFHPPILYLGYVGFTVPFAFAIAALVTGRVGEGWLLETRRWALFAWAFLTIGILLGGWWSYEVLGWSGVWAWDPGRERQLPAVAHRHRLPPLGARAGAARDAAGLEPEPARGHVRADDPRHVPHPLRRAVERPRLRRRPGRQLPAGVLRARRRRVAGAHRLARRPAALAGRDRLAAVARGRLPRQQRAVHGVRVRRAARHRVPAARRGAAGPPHRRRARRTSTGCRRRSASPCCS